MRKKENGGLAPREIQVLHLMAKGYSLKLIAVNLGIAPGSVNKYVERIYERLVVSNRLQALVKAHELGLDFGIGPVLDKVAVAMNHEVAVPRDQEVGVRLREWKEVKGRGRLVVRE